MLRSAAAYGELQAIAGFFAAGGGQKMPFWFAPPGLSSASLARRSEPGTERRRSFRSCSRSAAIAGLCTARRASRRSISTACQATGWTVSGGYLPAITFATAPGAGVAITADFGVLWLCRFAEDAQDFEEFMAMLLALKTLRLSTVRP